MGAVIACTDIIAIAVLRSVLENICRAVLHATCPEAGFDVGFVVVRLLGQHTAAGVVGMPVTTASVAMDKFLMAGQAVPPRKTFVCIYNTLFLI